MINKTDLLFNIYIPFNTFKLEYYCIKSIKPIDL